MSGPADQIDAIKSGKVVPYAWYVVSQDDVAAGAATRTAPVNYFLPKGVRVKEADEKRTVTFTLTPTNLPE